MPAKNETRDKWNRSNSETEPRENYVVNRLTNAESVAEGPNLLPPVVLGLRVQPPSGFRIARQEELKYASRFILAWLNNPDMARLGAKYRIYVYAQGNVMPISTTESAVNTPGWTGPLLAEVMADTSPAEVVIRGFRAQPVTFAIETRLPNGFISVGESRPTCAGKCNPLYHVVKSVTATYSATFEDEVIIADGTFTVTLFDCRQLPIGFVYTLKNVGAGTITWAPFLAAQTMDGAASIVSAVQYETYRLLTDGTVWHVV